MLGKTKFYSFLLIVPLVCVTLGWTARAALPETLTADQIVIKNIEARGGLQAWRAIHTMKMAGKMDAGSKDNVQLPFVLKMERPRKSRLEIEFAGSTALQVYDGTNGWKVRPFLGRLQVEPYTQEEIQIASEQSDLDGILIDHETKGIKVELEGTEPVENHNAYKLRLTMQNGNTRHLWLDAQTFLEVKIEGNPRKLDGKMHKVETFYRDYKKVGSVTVPFVMETAVEKVRTVYKINFETVDLNPVLESNAFSRPEIRGMKPAIGLGGNALQMQHSNGAPFVNSSESK